MTASTDELSQLLDRARAWRDADPDAHHRADLDARIQRAERVMTGVEERPSGSNASATQGTASATGTTVSADSTGPHSGAIADLRACFDPPLGFGTAGLRGLNGPGPAHMNTLLIQRVTAVMADVLRAEVPNAGDRGVVIGYDARHGSKALAEAAARTLAGAEFGVHVFDDTTPTPLVAFATLELGAAAGIVLTASHNPPEYLGYKVYWSNGAPLVSPLDQRIGQALTALPVSVRVPQGDKDSAPFWTVHGDALRITYYAALKRPRGDRLATGNGTSPTRLRIAYSALHGVAADGVSRVLAAQGGVDLHTVDSQIAPDGDFPTIRFPNPEEDGVLDQVTALAEQVDADLALATDPDGDRLAVAMPDDQGRWQVLMGDQTGALLADYLLSEIYAGRRTEYASSDPASLDPASSEPAAADPTRGRDATPVPPDRHVVINTVVSSRLLGRIARAHGVDFEQTLTGFKWIWHRALQREAMGDRFVFGYEDAIGFSTTRRVRDKDGIAAAVAVVEMARATATEGRTLYQRLQGLYARHGLSVNRQINIKLDGPAAGQAAAQRLAALRSDPPRQLAGLTLLRLHDYQAAESRDPEGGDVEPIGLPATDMVQLDWRLDGAGSAGHRQGRDSAGNDTAPGPGPTTGTFHANIRPSGTEPKVKIYLEYLGEPGSPDLAAESTAAEPRLMALGEALAEWLKG